MSNPSPLGPRTRRFRALEHAFRVTSWDEELTRYLDRLLDAFTSTSPDGAAVHEYALVDTEAPRVDRYETWLDGERIAGNSAPAFAVDAFLWHLNRRVIAASVDRYLLVHGAAAEHGGRAVVLPASMGAGKTTFVAALVRAGLGYLTDEAVALDRDTGQVVPYPKPLTIEPGSFALHADLEPRVPPLLVTSRVKQWNVPPASIRPAAVAPGPATPAVFVAPRYVPGALAVLEPVSRAAMAALAGEQAASFTRLRPVDLHLLVEVVGRLPCYAVATAELGRAVELVVTLLGEC